MGLLDELIAGDAHAGQQPHGHPDGEGVDADSEEEVHGHILSLPSAGPLSQGWESRVRDPVR